MLLRTILGIGHCQRLFYKHELKEQRLLVLERNYQIAVASAIIRSASHMNKHARCTCTVTTVPPTFCEVPVQPDAARCAQSKTCLKNKIYALLHRSLYDRFNLIYPQQHRTEHFLEEHIVNYLDANHANFSHSFSITNGEIAGSIVIEKKLQQKRGLCPMIIPRLNVASNNSLVSVIVRDSSTNMN
ncbi:hypothetical protein CEXT_749181 [Caerostris extrusa]|uniref:Uncharacterized protein n=1 Tax=Caerostris extrusa TaxID=172846 RepID=A0AAV4V2I0_CAEEX|nr:hypothetical protein CEXT_749181 [Caerostris extrusa]